MRFAPKGQAPSRTVESAGTRVFGYGQGVFHEVVLAGLTPDTEYDYQIRSGDGAWTPRRTFRTAPASEDAVFVFLAGSDTKGAHDVLSELFRRFETDEPRFMVYAGDAPHHGDLAAHWDRWFAAVEPFASQRPIMPSTGNHELGASRSLANYQTYNALPPSPGNEAYYSFDYGPVHFVSLDTESVSLAKQLPWLEKDLAATDKPWKVVYGHGPPFSSGTVHGSRRDLRNVLGPMFGKHRVNLVLSGHDHLYERSKPIDLAKSKDAPVNSYREGTCYVVSAGAGAGLYGAKPGNWWTAVLKTGVHHLCRVKVNGSKSMLLEAVDQEGRVIDAVTLDN